MEPALLDTDTLSHIQRQTPIVVRHSNNYLRVYSKFTFSDMTKYDLLRGLKAKQATVQVAAFLKFCSNNELLPVRSTILDRATDIYAELHRRGQIIGDADIIIAATAIVHNLVLITNNTRHFSRIPDIALSNWFD